MRTEITDIIHRFAGATASFRIGGGQGSEFEQWLYFEIANRLRLAPFDAELRDASNTKIGRGGVFVSKGAPGYLGTGQACHASFLWDGEPHELHSNIRFLGRSTQTHEIDISIIPEIVASYLRAHSGGRPTGHPRFAIECKFKSSNGSRDEARQVVARQFDMTFLHKHPHPWLDDKPLIWPESAAVTNGHGKAVITYMGSFGRCFNALCRIGPVTRPTGIYLAFNHVQAFKNLRPGATEVTYFLDKVVEFLKLHSP